MRKISLDANALAVESFETVEDKPGGRGTVHAHITLVTCPRTQCGEECLSGPQPCFPTEAWTNGQDACLCNQTMDCID